MASSASADGTPYQNQQDESGEEGKKGKKKKTTLSIHEFLGPKADELVVKKTSWADEMEQQGNDLDDDPSTRIVINRSALPTAPRSARGADVDLSRVPKEKPFTAFLANLPFEVSEEDIRHFFKDLSVITIRLLTDTSGRLRGSGYVEFETREMLIEALNYAESMLKGRAIRVDLADHHDKSDRDRSDGGFRSRDRDRDDGDDKTLGDWRKKDESSSDRFPGRERKDAYDRDRGSEHDRYDGKDRDGESRRGWGGSGSRDGDRYGNFGNRQDRGYHDDRDRDRDFGRSSFGSSFRNRDQFQQETDRFGGRDSGRRSEDRFRSDNRYRNEDGYRNDNRHPNDDGHRDGLRSDDWSRSSDRPESDRFRNTERRDTRFHDGDKYRDSDRNERPRDSDRSDSKFSGRYRDIDRDYGDRNRDVRRSNDRGRSRDEGEEEERGQERGHERGQEKGHDRSREDDREIAPSTNKSRDVSTDKERPGPKGRPKLNLQPRTKPLEEAGQMASSSSIFGGAKPIDTTQKLREIEEKHSSKLRQKPEKEDGDCHEEDHQPNAVKQQTSSEGPTSEENSVYKRQNSANSKNRLKRETTQEGSGSEKRREHSSNTSGSSGRGSTSGRRTSHSEADDTSNVDLEVFADKAAPPAAVKMIPAPPPKENFWEKRKTEAAQHHHQAVASTVASVEPPTPAREDATETNADLTKEISKDESDLLTVEVGQVSLASDAMPDSSDSSSPRTAPEERTAEPAVDAPVVNVWEARRKENETKIQKAEKPLEAPSHEGEVRKRAVVSIADVKEFGGRASGTAEHNDRWPGGARGGRRGGTGARRSEGGEVRRSDPDSKRAGSKKEKDKPLPASIDEMPKLEDKSKKDWSDRNKFSSLQLEEEENDSDVENKDSDHEDN